MTDVLDVTSNCALNSSAFSTYSEIAIMAGTTSLAASASFAGQLLLDGGSLSQSDDDLTVASFSFVAGIIEGSGDLIVTAIAVFSSAGPGEQQGSDGEARSAWSGNFETGLGVTQLAGQTSFNSAMYLDGGRTLENSGAFCAYGGEMVLGASPFGANQGVASVLNTPNGSFDIAGGFSLYDWGSGSNTFTNAGLLELTGAGSYIEFGASLINTGSLTIGADDTLLLYGDSQQLGGAIEGAGTLIVATNATLATSGLSVGLLDVCSGGCVTLGGDVSDGGALELDYDGVLDLSNCTLTVASFSGDGGVVEGPGAMIVTGAANFNGVISWDDGNYESGDGVTQLQGVTQFNSDLYLDSGRILENSGAFYANSGEIVLGQSPDGSSQSFATFQNDASAIFDVTGCFTIDDAVSSPSSFVNDGLAELTGDGANVEISATLVNVGTLLVGADDALLLDGDDLQLGGAISGAGTLIIAANAVLDASQVAIASLSINAGTTSLGADVFIDGALRLGGGAIVLNGWALTVNSLNNVAGAFAGPGALEFWGSTDRLILGGDETLIAHGSDEAIFASAGDALWLGNGGGDAISGAGLMVYAMSGASFSVGGNSGRAIDNVVALAAEIAVSAQSDIELWGSNDAVSLAAADTLTVHGDDQTIVATSGDAVWLGASIADVITGSGFACYADNGASFCLGENGVAGLVDDVAASGAEITVYAQSNVEIWGSSDTVTLAASDTLALHGGGQMIFATVSDALWLGAAADDVISGAGFVVHAAQGASFSVGGNGVAGAADGLAASGVIIDVSPNSNVEIWGASDIVTLAAHDMLTVHGGNQTISATAGDVLWFGASSGDGVSGAGFTLHAASGAAVGFGGASGALDQAIGLQTNWTLYSGSNANFSGAEDTIVSLGGSAYVVRGANDSVAAGANDLISLKGAADIVSAASNDTINASGSDAEIGVGGIVGDLWLKGLGAHKSNVIDLINGVGGFATAAEALGAIANDGHGNSYLSLGGYGTIHFVGITNRALSAANFAIG